jgi:hypothetical protein
VPPRLLMCSRHWRMVPAELQAQVWKHYRPGQEVDKRPTQDYLDVMDEAIAAVAKAEVPKAYPIPASAKVALCKDCAQGIYFVTTPNGRKVAVDAYEPTRGHYHGTTCQMANQRPREA